MFLLILLVENEEFRVVASLSQASDLKSELDVICHRHSDEIKAVRQQVQDRFCRSGLFATDQHRVPCKP